ncbi:hypothetical protein EYF80_058867 [Liparis tanakae]|uniref:Uncharacterized protein n=1 Tax=Liparis tanakae TaxID=230148 RepID=A0A4Z2EQY4_9TELE|nr:hypothetical protein EYF80_058867 [Liparis tanakae]
MLQSTPRRSHQLLARTVSCTSRVSSIIGDSPASFPPRAADTCSPVLASPPPPLPLSLHSAGTSCMLLLLLLLPVLGARCSGLGVALNTKSTGHSERCERALFMGQRKTKHCETWASPHIRLLQEPRGPRCSSSSSPSSSSPSLTCSLCQLMDLYCDVMENPHFFGSRSARPLLPPLWCLMHSACRSPSWVSL